MFEYSFRFVFRTLSEAMQCIRTICSYYINLNILTVYTFHDLRFFLFCLAFAKLCFSFDLLTDEIS